MISVSNIIVTFAYKAKLFMSSENVCLICVNFVSNIVIVTSHGVLFFFLGEGEAEDCFLFSSIQLFLQCFISHSDCTSQAVYSARKKHHFCFRDFSPHLYILCQIAPRLHLAGKKVQWGNRAIIPLVQFSLDRNLMFIIHISIVIVYIRYIPISTRHLCQN